MFGKRKEEFRFDIMAALAAVYIFWGGTYLGMKFAIETLPPFTMAGIRFVTAGAILYIWELAHGKKQPGIHHWKNAAVVGILMLLGGNGGVVWAEQVVPSGIAAIIIATVPLWLVMLAWLWQGGQRPAGMVVFGLLLGFCGILILVKNSLGIDTNGFIPWSGYVVLIFSAFAWAAGSLYSRSADLPESPWMAIALQMLTGGFCCMAVGLFAGEWTSFDIRQISYRSVFALGYLIFFGSIVAFSAYIWLLKAADPVIVSTYAYVNPVVAVLLGWAFAGETLSRNTLLAAAIIVCAVVIITTYNARGKTVAAADIQLGTDGEGI